MFLYYICIGEVGNFFSNDFGFYKRGHNPNHFLTILTLFIISSSIILVVMMNLLIALMGDVQSEYQEMEQQTILKSKLNFVIANWNNYYFKPPIENRKNINYLIAAIINEEDDDDIEIIKDI